MFLSETVGEQNELNKDGQHCWQCLYNSGIGITTKHDVCLQSELDLTPAWVVFLFYYKPEDPDTHSVP